MKIHKEGYIIIPVSAVLLSSLYLILQWVIKNYLVDSYLINIVLGTAVVIFWIFIVRFFRIPKINPPLGEKSVLAPAEGTVVVIEQTYEEEYLKENRIQISIFMSPLNVHNQRSPVDAVVDYFRYHPGKFLVAWHPKSSTDNERTSIGLKMADGTKLMMRQIAGAVARRIRFYKSETNPVSQAEEVGFIRFGSRVDIFLPLDATIKVKIGEKTSCAETVLAELA